MSATSSEPPSDGSPPRPRPPAARKVKDSAEQDLWDFDDPAGAGAPATPMVSRNPRAGTPAPRPAPASVSENFLNKRVSRAQSPSNPYEQRKKSLDDIGDLDDFPAGDEVAAEVVSPTPVPVAVSIPTPAVTDEPWEEEEAVGLAPDSDEGGAMADETESVKAERIQVKWSNPFSGLSKLERIGLVTLAAVLAVTAIVLLVIARNRLPIQDEAGKVSYPVKGSLITVKSAESFWREPVEGKDSVRRDTKLIPVMVLHLEGGPCAIRAFFRNDQGETMGDTVTRSVGTGDVEIFSTAGLEDVALHASYRLGDTKPWRIEVLEGPSVDSPKQEFKPLLNAPISNDRR